MYIVSVLFFCVVFSTIGVVCHPSPFLGAISLLLCVLVGCGYLVCMGNSFVGVVLLLVYLGGVLVVYAYSIALACDEYTEAWGAGSVFNYVLAYGGFVMVLWSFVDEPGSMLVFNVVDGVVGVSLLYSCGGLVLFLCGYGLLLALFSALELVRGRVRGGLRMV